MGNGDHSRSSLCLVRQKHHDPSFGGRIEAGCGLINHEQARIGKQFGRQTCPFGLAP